jgi:hypothetical protein
MFVTTKKDSLIFSEMIYHVGNIKYFIGEFNQ